ncbi:Hsp20 family protein [Xylophilus sp. Kf1]|nr:Hsp20 family protein [Xylophilus sp. Kf1]
MSDAFTHHARKSSAPSSQVSQQDDTVVLSVDVPGLSREQIEIRIDANVVQLQAVDNAPRQLKVAYELAHDIDADTSEAKLENGVLTLKLTRKPVVPTYRNLAIS